MTRSEINEILLEGLNSEEKKKVRTSNVEAEEFNYPKAFREIGKSFKLPEKYHLIQSKGKIRIPEQVDMRYEYKNLSILVETKDLDGQSYFTDDDETQLKAYEWYESKYRPNNNIISILADSTKGSTIVKIWKNEELLKDEDLNSILYYFQLFDGKFNDKLKVLNATTKLNKLLHKYDVDEVHRSQFVGSCLVAMNDKNNSENSLRKVLQKANDGVVDYQTEDILKNIRTILKKRISKDLNKNAKLELLLSILDVQQIRELKVEGLIEILNVINNDLIPFIREESNQGEDLLNLFFTTFNKYTGKKDKNQAFTPPHITDFMSDLVHLQLETKVLDPTCGSGAFLIQAMKKITGKTDSSKLKEKIRENQIYGLEKEEQAFALAATNMLIHEDGKSNIQCRSCFFTKEEIENGTIDKYFPKDQITAVLMNPPFNAKTQTMPKEKYFEGKSMDPTKGFYFVNYIAGIVKKGYLCTILPYSCAIGSRKKKDSIIDLQKKEMLDHNTLEAVFSLPSDIFYPGTSASACIMLFRLGDKHNPEVPTYFAYCKNDGFEKRKNLGRVEIKDWEFTKKKWVEAFNSRKEILGFSVQHKVNYKDEWLAEAYMDTDYSKLSVKDFSQTVRDFISYEVKNGKVNNE